MHFEKKAKQSVTQKFYADIFMLKYISNANGEIASKKVPDYQMCIYEFVSW